MRKKKIKELRTLLKNEKVELTKAQWRRMKKDYNNYIIKK